MYNLKELDKDISEIKVMLPKALVDSGEKTERIFQNTLGHHEHWQLINSAVFWNTISLAFAYGREEGNKAAFEASIKAIGAIGRIGHGHGK